VSYAGLALPFVLLAAAVLVAAAVTRRPGRDWWLATGLTVAALLALTVAFDNLMIAADLFRFGDEHLSGARLGQAPVEDLAWPLAAGLGLPGLALLVGADR
jgi:lycopene cyclase domain-containing protein